MHEEYCRSLAFGLYNSFSQSFPFLYLSLIFMTHPSWVVCSFAASNCWSFHNLEPSKLEGCRLALRRCVEARCQDVECLSTLSVWCLVIALSDCIIIVSSCSDGELLLTRIHYVLFLSTFIYGSTSEFQIIIIITKLNIVACARIANVGSNLRDEGNNQPW